MQENSNIVTPKGKPYHNFPESCKQINQEIGACLNHILSPDDGKIKKLNYSYLFFTRENGMLYPVHYSIYQLDEI